ncbi:hypothetical protein F66182_1558 [Fusarium sp. NRRL 66182]|nr:hypothetical protein F66182_1558 [Fusarium sp. NRRL 66182]
MSLQDFEPIELDDGRLVCAPHGLVVCGRCCVDYSFMDEILDEADSDYGFMDEILDEASSDIFDEDYHGEVDNRASEAPPNNIFDDMLNPLERGTGNVFPSVFVPPSSARPDTLFPVGISHDATPKVTRFIHRNDPKTMLIYTDGCCLNNGQADPKAGWAFVFRPQTSFANACVSGRLENKGPFGDDHSQTSNRAELRAVIGALGFRYWKGEGFSTLVFATDSEYVVEGATKWVRSWLRKGWKTSKGAEVKNKDLWEALLGEVERFDTEGLKIQFWKIPREWNVEADRRAKEAAQDRDRENFGQILGVLC